jgi:hypothetical protein
MEERCKVLHKVWAGEVPVNPDPYEIKEAKHDQT